MVLNLHKMHFSWDTLDRCHCLLGNKILFILEILNRYVMKLCGLGANMIIFIPPNSIKWSFPHEKVKKN